MKTELSPKFFDKYSYIKFHENPSSGSRDVPSEQTDGRTDMTKLIVAIRNFANAPKHYVVCVRVGNRQPSYRDADKSLARPTSRCILFDGQNISFHASLVIYI